MTLPTLDLVQHLSGDKTATHYPDISGFGRDGKFVNSPSIVFTIGQYIQCPQDLTGITVVEIDSDITVTVDETNDRLIADSGGYIARVLLSDETELFAGYCDSFVADRLNVNNSTHTGTQGTQDSYHHLETLGYSIYDNGDRVILGDNNNAVDYASRVSEKVQLPLSDKWIGGCNIDFTNGNPSQTWVADVLSGASYTVPVNAEFGLLHRTDKRNPHFCRWNDSFSNNDFILYDTVQSGQDLIDVEEWLDNGAVSLFVSADGDQLGNGSFLSPLLTVDKAHDNIIDGDIINVMYNQKPRTLSGELTFNFDNTIISTSVDLTTELSVGDAIKNENSLWYKVTGVTSTEIDLENYSNSPKYMDETFTGSAVCMTPTTYLWSFFGGSYTKNNVKYNGSVDRSGVLSDTGISFCHGYGTVSGSGCEVNNTVFIDGGISYHSLSTNSLISDITVIGKGSGVDDAFYSGGDNTVIKNLVVSNGTVGLYGENINVDYLHIFNYNASAFNSSLTVGANDSSIKRVRLRYASFAGVDAMGVTGVSNDITYYPIIDENNNIFDDTGSDNNFVKIQPVVNNAPLIPVYLDNMPTLFVGGRYVIGYKSSVNDSAFSVEKSITTPVQYTPIQGRNEIQVVAKFDDGYWQPESDPTTITIYAYTELVRAYLGVLINLLPQGDMWKVRETRVLAGLLTAFAVEYEKFDVSVDENLFDLFANNTVDYLTEWETDMGIPGDCRILESTDERRRQTILSKFRRFGGNTASVDYIENLLLEFGYDVKIVEYPLTVDAVSKGVFDFEIWSDYAGTETIPLKFGDVFGKKFSVIGNGLMDCIVNKFKPLGTTVSFKVNP